MSNDTKTQDFAILRVLLAILETMFHRYDLQGNNLNAANRASIWLKLWNNKKFPEKVVNKYLKQQHDKFYLFDNQKPFFQVTKKELIDHNVNKTSIIQGKLINRLISESDHKLNMFTPTNNKNQLTNAELCRWLITFQQFTSTFDKAKYPQMKASANKGLLLDIGGIYLSGNNLFETLMLNLNLNQKHEQVPIWETEFEDKLHLNHDYIPNNLAELYTNNSRLLYIDPQTDLSQTNVKIKAVQLPGIDLTQLFKIEPMTAFRTPKSGKYKGQTIPLNHEANQLLWRNFGLFPNIKSTDPLTPRIIKQVQQKPKNQVTNLQNIQINTVGMIHNHDASNIPNNEIFDSIQLNQEILALNDHDQLLYQINDTVEHTKFAIELLRRFIRNVMINRNRENDVDINKIIDEIYFQIDLPFKNWLTNINSKTNMQNHQNDWYLQLRNLLYQQAKSIIMPLSMHDLEQHRNAKTQKMENNITKYTIFNHTLKQYLNIK